MNEKTLYHVQWFPIQFLLEEFFPSVYGVETIAPSVYEIPLERNDANYPFWRTYRLLDDGSHVRDLRSKIRAWETLKVHAGLPLDSDPESKPIVLDIDLDEETFRGGVPCDCVRSVCDQCWFLVAVRIQVARYVLTQVFGFEKRRIKVLFSGRRGVHIWLKGAVYPEYTRYLFLKRFRQLAKRGKHVHCQHTKHIYKHIILPMWRNHFSSSSLDDSHHRRPRYASDKGKEEEGATSEDEEGEEPDFQTLFDRYYPRLDEPVIKQAKHAIGCPLSTHKKTGNVIQPIIPGDEYTFRPVHCTQVTPQLLQQWCDYLME